MIASIAGLIAGVAVWAAATRSAGVLGPALGLLVASVVRGAIAVRAAQVALRMPMTRTRSAAVALAGGAVGLALLVAIAAGVLVRR
jgi:hypothetical protein